MGILDLKASSPGPKPKSIIDAIFQDPEIDQEYKDHLLVALIHPGFPHVDILNALHEDGVEIGITTVKAYRSSLSRLVLSIVQESDDE